MKKEACFLLGYIASKYSFKGELLFKLDTDEPEEYENMESVFVAIGANLVPYFILERSWHKNMLRVRLQGIETETDASNLIGSELYLPLTALKALQENQFYYHEVIGFSLIDQNNQHIGIVKSVNDSTAQHLFVADHNGVSILVPLVDEFILKVDKKAKEIHLNLPEGLLDLYLNA